MIKIYFGEGLPCGVSVKYNFIDKYIKSNSLFEMATCPEEADYILYTNNCVATFENIEFATNEINHYLAIKSPNTKIIVGGCITGKLDNSYQTIKNLQETLAKVDYVLGVNYLEQLFKLLGVITDAYDQKFNFKMSRVAETNTVKIHPVDGCLNKCTFCKNNYLDAPLISIPEARVMEMINRAVEIGSKAVFLSASNLTQYGIDINKHYTLHKLVKEISCIDEIKWIILKDLSPSDMCDEIVEEIAGNKKIKCISLPIQVGSDRLLKLMNRKHTVADLRRMLAIIRNSNPDLLIETGLICGFPTETEKDVIATMELIYEFQLRVISNTPYINSIGVPSSKLPQLSEDIIQKHIAMYMDFFNQYNRWLFQKTRNLPVLVDYTDGYNFRFMTRSGAYYDGTPNTEEERSYVKTLKIGDEAVFDFERA